MLPPPDASASLPPSPQIRHRVEAAPIAPERRHIGFGQRLRGWLARLSRPDEAQPRAAETPAPTQASVSEISAMTAVPQSHADFEPTPGPSETATRAPATRVFRLDPARDDSDWRRL